MTVAEVLKLPLKQRLKFTGSKNISSFTLDNETYTGYKGYSFFWELTLVSQPERSQSGEMDLSSNAWFITPHLRIDFSLISYDDFKRLRQQQLSKLTFMLTCYDTDFGRTITEEVYFHPDTLPNFQFMARKLNGEKWTEILGAKDYTIELVGTNRTALKKSITYNINPPSDAGWSGALSITKQFKTNSTVGIGSNAFVVVGKDKNGNDVYEKVSNLTFGDKYTLTYWAEKSNGSGKTYMDGDEYMLTADTTIYAIWDKKT